MTDIVVLDAVEGVGKDVATVKAALPPPPFLSSELVHIFTSQAWTAPADGYLRACLSSGGGGGYNIGTYSGGASALAFWRWRKITKNQQLTVTLGAGGTFTVNGGTSTLTAPWGSMTASPGSGASSAAHGAGGQSGTGADYYYQGGAGAVSVGGALNPLNLPVALVTGVSVFKAVPSGWLSAISGNSIGNGGNATGQIPAGYGGGGFGATSGVPTGGAGLLIIEFCQAVV